MGEIIGINKPNHQLVRTLEGLLIDARCGHLRGFAAVLLRGQETDFSLETNEMSAIEVIGALELLKSEVIQEQQAE